MRLPYASSASLILALALVFPLVASSGCSPTPARGGKLEGIAWIVDAYADAGTMRKLPAGASADARFSLGTVSGTVLNSYNGAFVTSDKGAVTRSGHS